MADWAFATHEDNSAEESHLQPMEDPVVEEETSPEKGHSSEGGLC